MTHVMNAIALRQFDRAGSTEDVAAAVGTTPGRLKSVLDRLEEQGYIARQGRALTYVYPTLDALLAWDPKLGRAAAQSLLAGLKRPPRRNK